MKKRLVMILALGMCMFLCACGGSESTSGDNKEDGFTPSKPTETTEQEETQNETVDTSNMTVEEMQTYYDTTTFVGTPRIETLQAYVMGDKVLLENDNFAITIQDTSKSLKDWKWYECIICDNNTPDDLEDDVVAYIFTTPVE